MTDKKMEIFRIGLLILPILLVIGCDLFENEGGDWENGVTVRVMNESDCLVNLYIDGIDEISMAPQDEFEKSDINRGIHLIEAYPWNDEQFSCDSTFTPELKNGDVFEWVISNEQGCFDCDPTPTPSPETPTPSPTPV